MLLKNDNFYKHKTTQAIEKLWFNLSYSKHFILTKLRRIKNQNTNIRNCIHTGNKFN